MWTFQELLMNCSWTIFFHNKFLNSSWTVMVNSSWTLVHEPTMRVFYELFMNCSWMFMNVHEQFIKSWTTFHRRIYTWKHEDVKEWKIGDLNWRVYEYVYYKFRICIDFHFVAMDVLCVYTFSHSVIFCAISVCIYGSDAQCVLTFSQSVLLSWALCPVCLDL